ncbi:MAG: VOC family protein [Planctomycetes bacterium]|nr:VOC family protein [Planctomycetota bacterium]
MLREAGFPEAAAGVDPGAVSRAIPLVEAALRELTPPALGLTGIHHASVIVTNAERARSFYGGILGLKEVPYPSTFKFPVIWYQLEEEQVHLILRNEADTFSPRHFALHVQDAASARKVLKEKGIEIRETVEIPGADRFFISDPDGNQIELIQWKVPWGAGPM